jgi:hypothetical protein
MLDSRMVHGMSVMNTSSGRTGQHDDKENKDDGGGQSSQRFDMSGVM